VSYLQADAVKPQPINISGLIKEVARLLQLQAKTKQIQLILQTDENRCVFADRDMVDLVLRNLLSNAIKYTPNKGTITLRAQKVATGVEVMVKDTGKGTIIKARVIYPGLNH